MKKVAKNRVYTERGEVFYLKKSSTIVIVVSNKLHNLLSKYLVAVLATDKNVNQVRDSLEFTFELKEKKLKVLANYFYTVDKQVLQEPGAF